MRTPYILASGLAAVFASQDVEARVFEFEADVLGTRANFIVSAASGAHAIAAFEAVRAEVVRLDRVFSSRAPQAELYRYVRDRTRLPSAELAHVLLAAEGMCEASGGAFNARPGGSLTLNGIAKGYIVDKALEAGLAAAPVRGLLVDIGGDIACKGLSPEGAWLIGLPDPALPFDHAPLVTEVRLEGGAVATSVVGPWGEQTLDPATGLAAGRNISASVVAASCMEADALATALMVLDARHGLILARERGAEARITGADGQIHTTAGWAMLAGAPLDADHLPAEGV